VAVTPKQYARHAARERERRREPDADAEQREPQGLADHHVHHVARLRTERHADADLLRALRDRVAMTPYRPTPAMTSASTANTPMSEPNSFWVHTAN
jgi:hypothetical protein